MIAAYRMPRRRQDAHHSAREILACLRPHRLPCRTPEAESAAVDKMAEVAPHIQDDFDMQDGALQELDVADRPENQVQDMSV